jgi:hypothetical protein
MPPYHPNASRAQQRLMFAKANRGEVSQADAIGRARATDYKALPDHVKSAAVKGLTHGLRKR